MKKSPKHVTPSDPKKIAFLGAYLPRLCGIATFTHDVCEAVAEAAPDSECFALAVSEVAGSYDYPDRVRFELEEGDLNSYRRAADFLNFNNVNVLCVQHEFGIYGGPAGSHLLALLKELRMPVVTTLHTILEEPNAAQRLVMDELIRRSERLVVMAEKGVEILRGTYGVQEAQIDLIPHGIPDMPLADSEVYKAQFGVEGRVVLLTFGLLGHGKGIEYAIKALPTIVREHPNTVYLILGATHPHLVESEGESYRLSLERLAEDRGVRDHVIFYNRFVSLDDLKEFIGATDIYLTPYLNEAQITSGTLAYVFGAGKAVVSTPYWHARELLADGRGTLVPFRDSEAIARAVCDLLDDPERLRLTRERAHKIGRGMIWPVVGRIYVDSFLRAGVDQRSRPREAFADWTLAARPYALPPLRLDHLLRLSDDTGIFQHATYTVPNLSEGYCTDDNARAFILCNLLGEQQGRPLAENLNRLETTYLAFISAAFNPETGRFRNFMSHGREWLEASGSEDSHGRAMWAAGTGVGRSRTEGHRKLCGLLFEKGLAAVENFSSPRAWSYTLLGIREYLLRFPGNPRAVASREVLTTKLVALWNSYATEDWPWFEPIVTYDNARLCQALLLSAPGNPESEVRKIALKSLAWLVSLQTSGDGYFRPIENDGFYKKNGANADFDQQPIEAQAVIAACLEAFHSTGDSSWSAHAKRAFEWFLGRNDLGLTLYDASSGGCGDGLHADRVNENQGAESTLAFHLSLAEMTHAEYLIAHPLGPSG